MNNWGCLSFFLLFLPAGIFIWAAGERRRRAALPPDKLKSPAAREELTQVYQSYLKNAGRYVRIPTDPRCTAGAPDQ